jgi:ABC-2 type transport system ATP-binding protein
MAEKSATNAVDVRGVTKSFGGRAAVDDLSFTVPGGSIFGFIGPNGSGKTTTLRMIMNILVPDRGTIAVLGSSGTSAARDRVTYLPEERGLYKRMTVRRLLAYYAALKGAPAAQAGRAIEAWLERMGLSAYADQRVEALSKGMSQKVQFIAAVASDPELVILDEPFSGLDPVNADVLKEAVLELRARGKTVIFSTHDMTMAERLCDRICMVFKGKKVLDGTVDEIQRSHGEDASAGRHVVHVRSAAAAADVLRALDGVREVLDRGAFQEIRYHGDPQALLRELSARGAIDKFELARPTLHEIFVRIARPEDEVYRHD